jgi:nitrite reductase/ring-hydroxylating ferredoxin subunit
MASLETTAREQAHRVGTVEEFPPGTHKVVEVAGRQLGVFNIEGSFYALPNVCSHSTGPLCEAKRLTGTMIAGPETGFKPEWRHEGEILACPWHGLEYHVPTGQCLNYKHIRLRRYAVEISGGEVFVLVRARRP